MNEVVIKCQNCYSWLFTKNEELKTNLWKALRFREKNYIHSRLYKQRLWDGFTDYFKKETGRFLTGLLPDIELALKFWKIDYKIIDERNIVKFRYDNIDKNFLNQWLPKGADPLELYDYQVDFVNNAIKYNRGIVLSPTSSGKAQPLYSLVYTPDGPKKMGDIKLGDEVCTPNGNTAIVNGVYPQGEKEIYEIVFNNDDKIRCCKEHLWKCNSAVNKWKNKIKDTEWLIKNLKSPKGRLRNSIPNIEKIEFKKRETKIDPYVFGLLLGDGRFHKTMIGFSNSDIEILTILKNKLIEGYSLKHDNNYDYYIAKENERGKKYNFYLQAIRDYNLSNLKSFEKFIPDDYKYNSFEERLELIQGLMDTDGTVSKNGEIYLYTTSEKMALDFKEMINSIGLSCRIVPKYKKFKYKNTIKQGKKAFYIYIKYTNNSIPLFKLQRKKDKIKTIRKVNNDRIIKEINYIGKEEAQCISLDSKDHMYVSNNCIQTHNTEVMISILKALPQNCPTLILANKTSLVAQNYERMSEWGFENIGRVYGSGKDEHFEPNVFTCATIQSIHKIEPLLPKFKALIVDEIHDMMSKVPKNTYNKMKMCSVRVAVSATAFKFGGKDKSQKYSVKGYFGPIFETKSDAAEKGILKTKKLQERGTLSKSNCKIYKINEPELMYEVYQDAVTMGIVQNMYFHNIVKRLALKQKGRTLILVERLDHGDYLANMIPDSLWVKGEDNLETRKYVIEKLQKNHKGNVVAIATQGIFNAGINVHVHNLINAAGGQADHIIIQRMGRGLRTAKDKSILNYYDFLFTINEYLLKHSNKRIKILKEEGHDIQIMDDFDF